MAETTCSPSSQPANPPETTDSGLRCPSCAYNLTGVVEDRCPECGRGFNRAWLMQLARGGPAAIPIWDDRERSLLMRFGHLCVLTWFQPARIGRIFPQRYSKRSAARFRWMVVLTGTIAGAAVLHLGDPRREFLAALLVGFVAGVGGAALFERMLTSALNWFVGSRPATQVADASVSWHGLVGMFRTFSLLEALAAAGALRVSQSSWFAGSAGLTVVAMYIIPLWWVTALSSALVAQPGPRVSRLFLIGMILVVAVIALLAAALLGLATALMWRDTFGR